MKLINKSRVLVPQTVPVAPNTVRLPHQLRRLLVRSRRLLDHFQRSPLRFAPTTPRNPIATKE